MSDVSISAGSEPAGVIELLQQMVRIDSVSYASSGRMDAEAELGSYVEARARQWGIAASRLTVPGMADNVLLTVRSGGDADAAGWLLFDSHLDTVAVDGMTIDPFSGELREGRVWGRGACDTKGTGAAMLWALKAYAQLPSSDRPNNIGLLFSVDEETTMLGVSSFIEKHLHELFGGGGRGLLGVVVGEPTTLRPLAAHNGVCRWRVTMHGRAAHGAAPWMGRNAIVDMARLIDALQRRYIDALDIEHPLTGGAVASINLIDGGAQPNIVPERCKALVERRLTPDETIEQAEADFRAVVDQAVEAIRTRADGHDDLPRAEVERVRLAPALSEAASQPMLSRVRRAMEAHGLSSRAMGAPFTTHAGMFAEAGVGAIVWGPGDPAPAHTAAEWVEAAQVELGAKGYLSMMRDAGEATE